jgi:hypothetical protein
VTYSGGRVSEFDAHSVYVMWIDLATAELHLPDARESTPDFVD